MHESHVTRADNPDTMASCFLRSLAAIRGSRKASENPRFHRPQGEALALPPETSGLIGVEIGPKTFGLKARRASSRLVPFREAEQGESRGWKCGSCPNVSFSIPACVCISVCTEGCVGIGHVRPSAEYQPTESRWIRLRCRGLDTPSAESWFQPTNRGRHQRLPIAERLLRRFHPAR